MKRISTVTKVTDKFGAGKHGYTDGDVVGGIPATDLEAAWFDNIQEEIAGVIEASGLALNANDKTQLAQALQRNSSAIAVSAGTADAITGAYFPTITALSNGLPLKVRATLANATTTPTFKADGTALKTIVKGNNLPLATNDIAGAGHWLELQYDLPLDKWVLLNPASGTLGSIGYGQTWQTLTGSRALATNYTNSTGRPIAVQVGVNNAGATGTQILFINGVALYGATAPVSGLGFSFGIIPPGATYSVTRDGGGTPTLSNWLELR